MAWIDETVLEAVRRRYGEPRRLSLAHEIDAAERELVLGSGRSGRRHDVTFFVFGHGRLALIRKPHFAPGLWRPPGGGIARGEDFEAGALREAYEELGIEIRLERYLLDVAATFACDGTTIPWRTHVLSAETEADELAPVDTAEIADARWGTPAELAGPIRELLLATGRGLWRYRVELHDAALEALALR